MNEEIDIPLTDVYIPPQLKQTEPTKPTTLHYEGNGVAILQQDNSGLSAYCSCPRKYLYNRVYRRTRNSRIAIAYGSALHAGLELYYTYKASGEPIDLNSIHRKTLAELKDFEIPLEEWRTPQRAIDTINKYIAHYEEESFDIIQMESGPAIELQFSLPLGEVIFRDSLSKDLFSNGDTLTTDPYIYTVQVYWIGKIDLLIQDSSGLYVADHKTTSMLGPSFWTPFQTSRQMQGYCYAAKQMLGETLNGVMINCIAGRKPTRTGIGTEFHRQKFFYPEETLLEWHENTLALCSDLLGSFKRKDFSMNTDSCVEKYGTCEYLATCSLPQCQRESFLQTDHYTNNTWNPLKH